MLEYVTLVAVAVSVLLAMSAFLRRGVQGMVRTVSDQVGDQAGAEQKFDDSGHLINSIVATRTTSDKETQERVGVINYIISDSIEMESATTVNAGFQQRRAN